jgi:tRNA dimethylallyltransferase
MQVYRDLRVLSARPTEAEVARAPHRLYGHVDGEEVYSVGRWQAEAVRALLEPGPKVLVGGTGLYFHALTHGLADMPAVPEAARAAAGERLAAEGEGAFREALRLVDPEAEARIEAGDRQRLVRAAAVHAATGRSLSDWRRETRPVLTHYRAIVIEPPREALYARCDARFGAMLEQGALAEVARWWRGRSPGPAGAEGGRRS